MWIGRRSGPRDHFLGPIFIEMVLGTYGHFFISKQFAKRYNCNKLCENRYFD